MVSMKVKTIPREVQNKLLIADMCEQSIKSSQKDEYRQKKGLLAEKLR